MRKVLLGLFMAASIPTFSQFYPATVTEESYPPIAADFAFRAHHASAYSYPDVNVNGNTVDLYTYSWDGGGITGSGYIPGATIAIRQYPTGTTPDAGLPTGEDYNPAGFPLDDAASIEVVLLRRDTTMLVLTAYYQLSTEKFMLNLFKWDGSDLIQEPGYPIDITVNGPTADFEWIRMDALTLDKVILTWVEQGRIFTKAGKVAGGTLSFGNTAIVNAGDDDYDQSDVALIDVLEGEPQRVKVHYVYTTANHQKLFVGGLLFDNVLGASPGASLTLVAEDAQVTTGEYLLPRIDAPDRYATDDWSYVVEEYHSLVGSVIFAGLMHQPVLTHRELNTGIEIGFPVDISPWPNENTKPVVAYAAGGANIYYCWGYRSASLPPDPSINHSLIGLKMNNAGNFLEPAISDVRYSLAPFLLGRVSGTLSIALSGNNVNSSGLFMAFVQLFMSTTPPMDYYTMGIKVTPWSDNHFRPSGIEEQERISDIRVYPNPFSTYFQLSTERRFNDISIRLYDLLGRQLFYTSGDITEVNQYLQERSNNLATGNYFLHIVGDKEQPVVIKLSKTN